MKRLFIKNKMDFCSGQNLPALMGQRTDLPKLKDLTLSWSSYPVGSSIFTLMQKKKTGKKHLFNAKVWKTTSFKKTIRNVPLFSRSVKYTG